MVSNETLGLFPFPFGSSNCMMSRARGMETLIQAVWGGSWAWYSVGCCSYGGSGWKRPLAYLRLAELNTAWPVREVARKFLVVVARVRVIITTRPTLVYWL